MKTNFSDDRSRMLKTERPGGRGSRQPQASWLEWRALVLAGALLGAVGASPPARAGLSAPDNVLYGIVVLGTHQVTAADTGVVVEARRTDGLLVARYRMGERSGAGDRYVLAIPVEEFAPRTAASAVLVGEVITIAVLSNDVEQAQQPFTVTERGQVAQLDFGTLPPSELTGFEAWAQAQGLDGNSQNEDADADGVSNLAEYFAGTNPTNAASRFLLEITKTHAVTRVAFDAVRAQGAGYADSVRHYALEQRVDLRSTNWQAVPGYSDIIGTDQPVVYEAPVNGQPIFFRGKVWLQTTVGTEFRLLVSRDAGMTEISFTTLGQDAQGKNRYYTLERTDDLKGGAWTAVPGVSNILGNRQIVTYPLAPTNMQPGFYRGRIELRTP